MSVRASGRGLPSRPRQPTGIWWKALAYAPIVRFVACRRRGRAVAMRSGGQQFSRKASASTTEHASEKEVPSMRPAHLPPCRVNETHTGFPDVRAASAAARASKQAPIVSQTKRSTCSARCPTIWRYSSWSSA